METLNRDIESLKEQKAALDKKVGLQRLDTLRCGESLWPIRWSSPKTKLLLAVITEFVSFQLDLRRKQFHVLVNAIHEMQSILAGKSSVLLGDAVVCSEFTLNALEASSCVESGACHRCRCWSRIHCPATKIHHQSVHWPAFSGQKFHFLLHLCPAHQWIAAQSRCYFAVGVTVQWCFLAEDDQKEGAMDAS